MGDERLTVRCACGWEVTGSRDEVVAATQEHGRRVHNMNATTEEVLAMAVEPPAPEPELQVVDHPEARRYEARLGDRVAGFIDYRMVGGRIVVFHTEIDPDLEGRGIGSSLVKGTLDDIRARGLGLRVKCPFVAAWLRRHPAYEDLVAS